MRNFFDFVREDVGIWDQEQLQRAFEMVCKDVGSIPIGVAKRSEQLALSMGEKLLNLHLKDGSQARAITKALNRSFYHHGYPLSPTEAKRIGLPVNQATSEIEGAIWSVWQDLEDEMEINTPFEPLQVVYKHPEAAKILDAVHQVQIPGNLPPQVMQEVLNNILQQIKVQPTPSVDYQLFQATVESVRCRSEFRTKGKITAMRLPDMNIAVNAVRVSTGWSFMKEG